jgi:two-component system chemotaxis response regulator CheY
MDFCMAKILVVDDSEIIRVQLKNDLLAQGYEVVEADNGLNGLELVAQHKDINLIISDVNMPEMDGPTMCKKLHQNPDTKHIPIVMLTTQSNPELKASCKEHGVIAWITKPYKLKGLLVGVDKILSKA